MKQSEDVYILECKIFSQHLIGMAPSQYIVKKYQEAHQYGHPPRGEQERSFDRFLLAFARAGSVTTKIADAYCSFFCKEAYLRKKLVLLLAILECAPQSYPIIDKPDGSSKFMLLRKCFLRGVSFSCAALASLVTLLPAHVVFLLKEKLAR